MATVAAGVYSAIFYMPEAVGEVRPEGVAIFDAMAAAESPRWLSWLNLPFSVAGLLLGARVRKR